MCHHIKHLGYAGILAKQGRLDYEALIEHFVTVNGCDQATFEEHHRQAFAQWKERSQHEWTVDYGEYAGLVNL